MGLDPDVDVSPVTPQQPIFDMAGRFLCLESLDLSFNELYADVLTQVLRVYT